MKMSLSTRAVTFRPVLVCLCCVIALAGLTGAKKAAPKPEPEAKAADLPWTLRPNLAVTVESETFTLGEDNAEWKIVRADGTVMVEKVFHSVTLEDGTVLSMNDFGMGKATRKGFTSPFGDGTDYFLDLPAKKGLSQKFTLSVPASRPFFIIRIAYTNTTDKPISIKKISSVIVGDKSVPNAANSIEFTPRRMTQRGPYPVFDTEAQPLAVLFHEKTKNRTLSLGLLPTGVAKSGASFTANGPVISGEVASEFTPAITLAPGQTIEADPVWVSFNVPATTDVDMFFAWTHSTFTRPKTAAMPKLYVSAAASTGADDLYAIADRWSASGCEGALVPAGWEGMPGSFEGLAPAYPKNMGAVAKELKGKKLKPGISVDPLVIQSTNAALMVEADGIKWLNLTQPDAKLEAARQLKKFVELGYEFFAIQPSIIPDAALKTMNISRAQADTLAFEAMTLAAEGLPVIPTSRARLGANAEAWREAAACVSRMNEYGIAIGPVALSGENTQSPSDELLAAIALYSGPIELLGNPSDGLAKKLARLFPKGGRRVKPLDSAKLSPALWEVPLNSVDDTHYSSSLIVFPGAASIKVADLPLGVAKPVSAFSVSDGNVFEAQQEIVATDKVTVYGLVGGADRPVLASARGTMGFLYNNIGGITWNADDSTLRGIVPAIGHDYDRAFIYVPAPWALDKGTFAEKDVKEKEATTLLALDLQPGSSPNFSFSFLRK